MPAKSIRLAVIVGSVRGGPLRPDQSLDGLPTRPARARTSWTSTSSTSAEGHLPMVMPRSGPPRSPEVARARGVADAPAGRGRRVRHRDPEYNHSFPAVLKNVIDWHGPQWHVKPEVGFVSYGGLSGGLRAVEHLRLVSPNSTRSASATPSVSTAPGISSTATAPPSAPKAVTAPP